MVSLHWQAKGKPLPDGCFQLPLCERPTQDARVDDDCKCHRARTDGKNKACRHFPTAGQSRSFPRRRPTDEATAAVCQMFELLEETFASGDIDDWSTNDWLCVRVLETIPLKYPTFIDRLIGWHEASSLWQRRSGLLAFKKSAKTGHHQVEVEGIISKLLPSHERFVQTAIGWVLSDASRKYPNWAAQMFEIHFEHLSHEVIVRHTKHLPNHSDLKEQSRDRRRKNQKIRPS